MTRPTILWLRDDLRLDDHAAFHAAADRPALVIYVHDEVSPGLRPLGGASRWWLAHSLEALGADIAWRAAGAGYSRRTRREVVLKLARASEAVEVIWSRRYGGAEIEIDRRIKSALPAEGVIARSVNSRLLREPWEVVTDAGAPFKVFTPFWRRHRALGALPPPLPAPRRLVAAPWPTERRARVDSRISS